MEKRYFSLIFLLIIPFLGFQNVYGATFGGAIDVTQSTEEVIVPTGQYGITYSSAISRNGTFYVWTELDDGDNKQRMYFAKSTDGVTTSTPLLLTTVSNAGYEIKEQHLHASGNATVNALDLFYRETVGGVLHNKHMRSIDAGVTWSSPTTIWSTPHDFTATDVDFGLNGIGQFIDTIAIIGVESGDYELRQSLDGGATWQTEVIIGGSETSAQEGILLIGSEFYNWNIFYSASSSNGMYHVLSGDNGYTWQTSVNIASVEIQHGFMPRFFTHPQGQSVLLFSDDDNSSLSMVRTDNINVFPTVDWDTPVIVHDGVTCQTTGINPNAIEFAQGNQRIYEICGSATDVYTQYSTDMGTTWSGLTSIGVTGEQASDLKISALQDRVYYFFQQSDTGTFSKYFIESFDGGVTFETPTLIDQGNIGEGIFNTILAFGNNVYVFYQEHVVGTEPYLFRFASIVGGFPDAVENLTYNSLMTTSLALYWSPLPNFNNTIFDYFSVRYTTPFGIPVTVYDNTTDFDRESILFNDSGSLQIIGLTQNTQYSFTVDTITFSGTNSSGNILNVTTAQQPEPVDDLHCNAFTGTTIDFDWSEPELYGALVEDGYDVIFTTPFGTPVTHFAYSNDGFEADFTDYNATGLTPATDYSFAVIGITSVGNTVISNIIHFNSDNGCSDTIPSDSNPVITLLGDSPQYVFLESTYQEFGATANDAEDGDLTSSIITDSSAVNTSVVGSYSVTYTVTDADNNTIIKIRTVNVVTQTTSGGGGSSGGESTAGTVANTQGGSETGELDPFSQLDELLSQIAPSGQKSVTEQIVQTFFEFQVINKVHDNISLQSFLSNQQLGIRWSNGDDIIITKVTPAQSPFTFTFESLPVIKIGSGLPITENSISYNLQVPTTECDVAFGFDCVEKIRYSIPVTVDALINSTKVSATGTILVDLTEDTINPILVILFGTIAIPIVAGIIWKLKGGNSPTKIRDLLE